MKSAACDHTCRPLQDVPAAFELPTCAFHLLPIEIRKFSPPCFAYRFHDRDFNFSSGTVGIHRG